MTSNSTSPPANTNWEFPKTPSKFVTTITDCIMKGRTDNDLLFSKVIELISDKRKFNEIPKEFVEEIGYFFSFLFKGAKGEEQVIRGEKFQTQDMEVRRYCFYLAIRLYEGTIKLLKYWLQHPTSRSWNTAWELKNKLEHGVEEWVCIATALFEVERMEKVSGMLDGCQSVRKNIDDKHASTSLKIP